MNASILRTVYAIAWHDESDTTHSLNRQSMKSFLDKIPTSTLAIAALLLALAPFAPEPHLWQKLKMLADGTLSKPIDIFDLFMHGTPVVLLALKLALSINQKDTEAS